MTELAQNPIRVLMIDDDEDDFVLCRALLSDIEGRRYVLEHIDNYNEGLKALKACLHDIFLVDLRLGPHSGLDLIKAANGDCKAPIILLTGTGSYQVDVTAMSYGAADYLCKDELSPHTLERAIRHAIERTAALTRVTESEASLRRSERELHRIISEHPDGVAILREEILVYANTSLTHYLGHEQESDLLGQPFDRFIAEPDKHTVLDKLRSLAQTGRDDEPTQIRLKHRGGDTIFVEWMPARTLSFEGEPATMVVLRDVSARRKLQARTMLAERLTSLGTMAAGVAHEINNPLAFVTANLSQMAHDLESMSGMLPPLRLADLKEMVGDALTGAERMRLIVNHLSTFTRDQANPLEAIRITALLDLMANMARTSLKGRARLVRDYAPGIPLAVGNEARLGQVFLNLIVNAAQAIPKGNPEDNEIRLHCRTQGRHVIIEISDTGAGIPEHLAAHIFDPFFTTRPVGAGVGLGLFICHSIITDLGGHIEVISEPGVGTTFRIQLDTAGSENISGPSPLNIDKDLRLDNTLKILIIDDEPLIASTLGRILKNHEVAIALTGAKALEMLGLDSDYDVVFCDLLMPGLSGVELFQRATDNDPSLAPRFVFMIGGTFTPQTRDFLMSVTNPTLQKPFKRRQLKRILTRQTLARRRPAP